MDWTPDDSTGDTMRQPSWTAAAAVVMSVALLGCAMDSHSRRREFLREAADRAWTSDPAAAERSIDAALDVTRADAGIWWRKALLAAQRGDSMTAMWALSVLLQIRPDLESDRQLDLLLSGLERRIDTCSEAVQAECRGLVGDMP